MGAKITTPPMRLGAWLARVNNTIYQAPTDGFVTAIGTSGTNATLGETDNATPPTVDRQKQYQSVNNEDKSICFPVRKGDYWRVVNGDTIFWIPLLT